MSPRSKSRKTKSKSAKGQGDGATTLQAARRGQAKAERGQATAERGQAVAEIGRNRFAFLAEVSRLLASSLDYEETLTTVAGLSLPYLGAWCIVDVMDDDGEIRRLAVLHPDDRKAALARELQRRYPPRPSESIGMPRMVRANRPSIIVDVGPDTLTDSAHDAEHLALLRELGSGAVVIAPMVARDRLLGAITFVSADGSGHFDDADLMLTEDLARRAAMAIDNARLHRDVQRANRIVSEAMQEAEVSLEEARAAEDELRVARDVAESALRARDEFVATMSHEVRTPLNAILGYTDLLDLELSGSLSQGQRTYLHRLRESSRHLLGLVDDVLDLSRTGSGQLKLAKESVDAMETASAAVAIVRPLAAGKHVTLTERSAESIPTHYAGDEHRVRQILVNLLGNAIKFTPPGGSVTVECRCEEKIDRIGLTAGTVVAFHVIDTGPGVAAHQSERIFEPFVQGEAGLTRTRDGSGLGLTISRRLARLMDGDVTLEAPPDGASGANFVLRLPAAGPQEKTTRARGRRQKDKGTAARAAQPAVPHRTPTERAAARRGLGAASSALLNDLGRIVRDFVDRVRADETLQIAATMPDVEVADHIATLVTDLANSMALLGEASGEPTMGLSDGKRIQRLIGELHGAQRHRLGWTEEHLEREATIVREVCEEAIVRLTRSDSKGAQVAQAALAQLLAERMRAGLNGFRDAARGVS